MTTSSNFFQRIKIKTGPKKLLSKQAYKIQDSIKNLLQSVMSYKLNNTTSFRRGQISLYLLFTLLAMILLLTIFVVQIKKMDSLKTSLETKMQTKETTVLDTSLNSTKKNNTYEPNYGPYISESDSNARNHYG